MAGMSKGPAVFIEPFILYWVLFLPAVGLPSALTVPAVFSLNQELDRIFTYQLPALALIVYLLHPHPGGMFRPRARDLGTVLLALPGLLILGVLVTLPGSLFPSPVSVPVINGPLGPAAVLVMILSCLSTGYLEETYFRLYLFTRFTEGGIGPVKAMAVSSLLFALCHIYEGPLGALNAFLAGLLLGFIFSRRKSIHGLAWAHGGYNIFVYIMAMQG
jgi:membrane protease YdiL (CAAX protease family)